MLNEWAPQFLELLEAYPNVSAAARQVGIDRTTAYKAREVDPEFARKWDDAIAASVDELEAQSFKRAKDNSDTLAMFLLKAHRPQVYREPEKDSGAEETWRKAFEIIAKSQQSGDSGSVHPELSE